VKSSSPGDPVLRLYELRLDNGRSLSPYVWRIRYVLAHKGLDCEQVLLGFTEIAPRFDGRFKTVPVLQHGDTLMAESWDIAKYLDETFPGKPVFSSPGEIQAIRLFDHWFALEVSKRLIGMYVLDIHDAARPEDRAYFRASREARFAGRKLEEIVAGRESRLPALREALQPLRQQLKDGPFLGGSSPSYADYIAWSAFQWVGSVATLAPLAKDDALRPWFERGFEQRGPQFQDPRLHPLFE
jgi:glutathione S-transferase